MDKALQLMPIVQWIKGICPNGQLFSDSREIKYETDAVFFAYEGDSADGRKRLYTSRLISNGIPTGKWIILALLALRPMQVR